MFIYPNLITCLRFLLVIPISIFIYQGDDLLALILFIVAGISDGLDGYLARRYDSETKFGQIADPIADKFLILATLLALAFSMKLPLWFVYLMLARDGVVLIGAILYLLIFDTKDVMSNRWGKHYTGWTIALFFIVLLKATSPQIPILIEWIAMTGVIIFVFLSVYEYSRKEGRELLKSLYGS